MRPDMPGYTRQRRYQPGIGSSVKQWSCCRRPSFTSANFPRGRICVDGGASLFRPRTWCSQVGDIKAAQAAMQPPLLLHDALAQSGDGEADEVNIQLEIVIAWIKWAEGDHNAALQEMRTAAAMEDAIEKSPVSPGSIAPASEMLGDMLLLAKQPNLALAAYESALKSTPGRFRAEYGAAVSAEQAGLRRAAEQHYRSAAHELQPRRFRPSGTRAGKSLFRQRLTSASIQSKTFRFAKTDSFLGRQRRSDASNLRE